jgi:polysaccharide pyruvyl transferase WcaK-like protein
MRVCLFGAAGDTANLGVSALMTSAVTGIARAAPGAEITVFDNGWGVRGSSVPLGGEAVPIRLCGARLSRRLHRPESLWNMRVAAWLGWRGNPGTRAMALADAVLDVSGGDSFADLYGPRRFRMMSLPKQIALDLGRPLVLLPQTYGPFHRARSRKLAETIVRRSAMAWARCERSFQDLRELLADGYDPARHRAGVDMAFALEAREPRVALEPQLRAWLEDERPLVGFNPSGLVYNDPEAGRRYGLRADYRAVVERLVARLLAESDARVLFVPHVVAPEGRAESDGGAARAIVRALPASLRERTLVAPDPAGPGQAKWLIARTHWFCGTRMHSTIAGLSSGVPTAAIAYSLKTKGVFESCAQGEHVADARNSTTDEVVERLWRSWLARESARAELRRVLPGVRERAAAQMQAILASIAPTPRPELAREVAR